MTFENNVKINYSTFSKYTIEVTKNAAFLKD